RTTRSAWPDETRARRPCPLPRRARAGRTGRRFESAGSRGLGPGGRCGPGPGRPYSTGPMRRERELLRGPDRSNDRPDPVPAFAGPLVVVAAVVVVAHELVLSRTVHTQYTD